MKSIQAYTTSILSAIVLLAYSCNNSTNKAKENNGTQTVKGSANKTDSAIVTQNNNGSNTTGNNVDTSSISQQNNNNDSMLSQMKNLPSMFGKNDSDILKNFGDGNKDSMMKKIQSMMGNKNGSPGDAIANSILNLQLGQMKDNNPLKTVAKGMMDARKNRTGGDSKTYTAIYTPEQKTDYTIPLSGNGNTIMLQYTGGSISNGKKDGLWKNLYISTNKASKWNVYSESYTESSALNMKVHATSLAGTGENYSIVLNDQYKKYNKQPRSDEGKNELDVQVKKMGNERMFGYNCVHIQITYTLKALGQTAHEQDDEWYSGDVPGAQFLSPVIFENHSPVVVKKIIDAGYQGVLVKSVTASNGISQLIQLSSITKKDMPDSIFNLPANYQEDKNTALYDIQ